MPSDRSRTSDDLRQQYQGVVLQQGRVILDRDFNDLQSIVSDQIAADALDEIGPCGTPDSGFLISSPAKPSPQDFSLAPGAYYVGGQRAVLPVPADGNPWSYFHQPDWVTPDKPSWFGAPNNTSAGWEAVYLHLFEQEVGAVEDPDLLDVALGGPDTTQRVRLVRRVERTPAGGLDCPTAWISVLNLWRGRGYGFDPPTMRLAPLVQLQVSFTGAPGVANPCDPVMQGGYLGAENQTIRVQIAPPNANGKPQLMWGYDNASFLYRVSVQADGTTMLLNQVPVDAYHALSQGQVVEVLRSAAIIPDGTDLPGVPLPRRVVEATGLVTTVASYNAADNSMTVNASLAAFTNDANPIFLRVWQGQQPVDPASTQPIVLTDPTGATSPGIQVMVSPLNKTTVLPIGSFWIFAVRPSTPQAVYPERYLAAPQPPEGPRQWLAPLGTLEWDKAAPFNRLTPQSAITDFRDCRPSFENLVDLSKRTLGGCCTITVAPADAPRLQSLIDSAVGDGRPITVCFTPGVYLLTGPLRLTKRHASLVLESCQGIATLQAQADANQVLFIDGLIVLVEVDNVQVRNIQFHLRAVNLEGVLDTWFNVVAIRTLGGSLKNVQSMIGIRLVQSRGLTVEGCSFNFSPGRSLRSIGAGILAAGDCTGLRVERCQFVSDTVATSTPNPAQPAMAIAPPVSPLGNTGFAGPAVPAPVAPAPPNASIQPLPNPGTAAPVIPTDVIPGPVAPLPANPDPAAPVPPPAPPPPAAPPTETLTIIPNLQALGLMVIPPIIIVPPAPTALCGIAALPFFDPRPNASRTPLQAVIHDAVVCDNDFTNLTLGMVAFADLGICRLHDNRVRGCWGGFWLASSDAVISTAMSPLFAFAEFTLGVLLGPQFPLPAELDATGLQTLLQNQAGPNPCHVDVSSNCIATLLSSPSGSCAVALSLVRQTPTQGQDASASAVVMGNDIRGRPAKIPIVAVSTDAANEKSLATLTGNAIVHDDPRSISLWIFPIPIDAKAAGKLAVTGNVLVGQTNLGLLTRSGGPAGDLATWLPFNSLLD